MDIGTIIDALLLERLGSTECGKTQIPRRPFDCAQGRLSPRKRGLGRRGMTNLKGLLAQLKAEPFQSVPAAAFCRNL
jgi:hypothetical protein